MCTKVRGEKSYEPFLLPWSRKIEKQNKQPKER